MKILYAAVACVAIAAAGVRAQRGTSPAAGAAGAPCSSLAALSLPNARITLAQTVEAGAFAPPDGGAARGAAALPAFCRVAATLTPTADSDIKIEVWLPASGWNGKFQAVGNGAFSGSIAYPAMTAALARGYATSSTDTGHEGNTAAFGLGHPDKVIDFGWRAVHEMTVASKSIVAAFYRSSPSRAYWNGCSAGGRQAMKEAQRFPADFDGIVAGAPGLDWTGRASQAVRVARALERPEARLTADEARLVHRAVVEACDALDGVRDGLLEDPVRCRFDPRVLECKGADHEGCLTPAQTATVRLMYSPALNGKTKREIAGLAPGSELGWTDRGWSASARATGIDQFRFLVFKDPQWPIERFDADSDVARAEEADEDTINALDPNVKPFLERGGKLIQYHGWSDPQIAPGNSTQYFARVLDALGASAVQRSYRLFMAPGMAHCGGGEGPNTFDMMAALERWVEKGEAPDRIVASHSTDGRVDRTRPLCPYPAVAAYSGTGSTDDASSFACASPGVSAQRNPAADDLPHVDVAAMLKTAVADLDRRIAQFKPVRMPFDAVGLNDRERQLIDQLVIASRALESMYWRQSDPVGLALYKALATNDAPAARSVRHYLFVNGSRWDLVHENQPFVGTEKMPPGRALYPADLTRAAVDAYVAAHPDAKSVLFDPYTMIRRDGAALAGRKYHDAYGPFAKAAADALRRAAELSPDQSFARFLRLRADALLSDDYYASDVAWVDLKNPKIDVIFAPYETYLDDLLGVKTSYGAAVMIRNEAESRNLELYERWVPDIQEALPLGPEDRPSVRGHATPMEVMDTPFRAGDLRHGYQAVADNLPNDPRIHKEKGTKKIFFKNFMDARVREVILPLAARVMDPAQAKQASAEGYLASTVLHEICHGLGPAFARRDGRQVDIREAMAGSFSGLEEAKADVVGMFALKWLVDKGALKKERLEEYYASYVAGIFRTVRFGTGEAHGRAEMMEFNYLASQGAVASSGGRYRIDYAKMPDAIGRLAKELLEQEATGNRGRAEAWFTKYDVVPPALRQALDGARDVPIDVDPIVSFDETVR